MKTYIYTSIPSQCFLGEGPYWHAGRQSFFWVDIENGKLFEHHLKTGETKTRSYPHYLAVVLESEDGNLILGLDRKVAQFDLETEELTWLCEVESDYTLHRFNDGKVDPKGRIWIGTLSTKFTVGAGSLYCINRDLEPKNKLSNLTISNGMAWTEDNQTFYFIDTPTRQIKAFQFDLETGEIEFEKIAVDIPEELGFPDGMCIDRDGMLWVAHYGGSGVYRWNPKNGELLDKIELPVPHITSCCFGGENLDTLLITSAQENMSTEQLKKFPMSGDVFLVKTACQGYLPFKSEF
ncbi:SMP-30/gluconolactonase/LRE family protein [Algoriphagus winogradskyi]|uniref:Sugar lactone lactonase YvrE n=1 Tax=Algoriphagus winogradskyi TaxID=237017 RepID=A0ABY1NRJ0_9BACT|nr:SMP-30/gluconolactonase/LRE family protein [Algoriphagus winogradskyi]SMP16037.1 Sugar lactone lactonase YvrE [Algoriphagus winogradskyi]